MSSVLSIHRAVEDFIDSFSASNRPLVLPMSMSFALETIRARGSFEELPDEKIEKLIAFAAVTASQPIAFDRSQVGRHNHEDSNVDKLVR